MKKKLSATLGALAACTLLAGLGGCSDSTGGTQNGNAIANPTAPVTMSEAFNTKSIWYMSMPSEDERFQTMLVFDGKGNVTAYYACSLKVNDPDDSYLTFSDIENLSDEEIIDIGKECTEKYDRDFIKGKIGFTTVEFNTNKYITPHEIVTVGGEEWLTLEARDLNETNISVGKNMYVNGYQMPDDEFGVGDQELVDTGFGLYTRVPKDHPGFILDN